MFTGKKINFVKGLQGGGGGDAEFVKQSLKKFKFCQMKVKKNREIHKTNVEKTCKFRQIVAGKKS